MTDAGSTIYRQLKDDWHRLHPNIQDRFRHDPQPGEKIVYEGVMHTIRRSGSGWAFAQLTRIIGNPLTPHAGEAVPMDVTLYKRPDKSGVYWQRVYFYPHRKPCTVTSVKRESARGEMMECVGCGFGMLLNVHVENAQLHFESYRYFWQCGKVRIPLPHWLSPGKTHVVHEDLGGGDFKFIVSMNHRQLGETFYQEGVFRRKI
jgi:hypothetical protein